MIRLLKRKFYELRAQRHVNMAALNPFLLERIEHFKRARGLYRKAGWKELAIDTLFYDEGVGVGLQLTY